MSVERVQELGDRLRGGDFEALRAGLSRDYFSYSPGADEPSAADRIADLAQDLKAALPDLTVTLVDLEPDDDGIVHATATIRGTHEGDLWGAPGSGDVFEWTTPMSIKAFGDGLAFRIDETTTPDRVGLLRRLRLVNPVDQMDQPAIYPVAPPDFLLKVVLTGEAGDRQCSHLGEIELTEPQGSTCEDCVALGDNWPALRMCLICGYIGCCDTSKNRHMAEHFKNTGHPIFRSINRDERWIWCYEDNAFFESPTLERFR